MFQKTEGRLPAFFDGVCKGPILGQFEGGEGGKVKGEASVECKIAFLTYNLKADYTGNLYLHEGKVELDWKGEIPYTKNEGHLSISFEPLN